MRLLAEDPGGLPPRRPPARSPLPPLAGADHRGRSPRLLPPADQRQAPGPRQLHDRAVRHQVLLRPHPGPGLEAARPRPSAAGEETPRRSQPRGGPPDPRPRPPAGVPRLPVHDLRLRVAAAGRRPPAGRRRGQQPDAVHVHSKAGKDRYVPLAVKTLQTLRNHWRTHRPAQWLFPAPVRRGARYFVPPGAGPISDSSLQSAFRRGLKLSRVNKRAHARIVELPYRATNDRFRESDPTSSTGSTRIQMGRPRTHERRPNQADTRRCPLYETHCGTGVLNRTVVFYPTFRGLGSRDFRILPSCISL